MKPTTRFFASFLTLLTGWAGPANAQIFYEKVEPGAFSMCVYEEAPIRETPGASTRRVGRILFGEEVQHIGETAFVRAENQVYIRVMARDGAQGWVAENYLLEGGGLVAMVANCPIYEKPNTVSSLTRQEFRTGELVILSDFNDQWMKLSSIRKERSGWVKGYDKVSSEDVDIEVASLLERANAYLDPTQRRLALQDITRIPRFNQSKLASHVQKLLNPAAAPTYASSSQAAPANQPQAPATSYAPNRVPPANNTQAPAAQPAFSGNNPQTNNRPQANTPAVPARPSSIPLYEGEYLTPTDLSALNTPAAPASPQPGPQTTPITIKEVFDSQTGKTYFQVQETGTFQAVQGPKNPATMYFAYHKTLPLGSKLWLELPDGNGRVQLEVVAPLRADNPNMLGLGAECIKALFGAKTAKEVGQVTIIYPRN